MQLNVELLHVFHSSSMQYTSSADILVMKSTVSLYASKYGRTVLAWTEDVHCDTCQLNIVSGLPKRACEKVASTHTVALTDSARRNMFLKMF
jgi:hypothetical protein